MAETMGLAQSVVLAEKIKKSYRAKWDEIRYQNEKTGEVSPTQYDLILELKGGKETLDFSYRQLDGEERMHWYYKNFAEPETTGEEWASRHDRNPVWLAVPDMLSKTLWDVVTVHGDEAQQRGWSEIDRKDKQVTQGEEATA